MPTSRAIWNIIACAVVAFILVMIPCGRAAERLFHEALGIFPSWAAQGAVLLSIAPAVYLWRRAKGRDTKVLMTYWCLAASLGILMVIFVRVPVEAFHVFIYCALAMTLYGPQPDFSPLKCLIIVNFVSLLDESLQGLHPQRVFDFRDLVLNLLGCLAGILAVNPAVVARQQTLSGSFLQDLLVSGRNYTAGH